MNLQYIKDNNGITQYVVLPIDEFKRLTKLDHKLEKSFYQDIAYEADEYDDVTIPSQVVDIMDSKNISLLAAWRLYRGLTQATVAKRSGLTQSTISQAEKVNKPHKKTCERLAKIYQCLPEQLIL